MPSIYIDLKRDININNPIDIVFDDTSFFILDKKLKKKSDDSLE